MASYTVIVRDAVGNKLTEISAFVKLDYARRENQVGVLTLVLPRCEAEVYFRKDLRLEIQRTVGTLTYLEGNTVWFLRSWVLSSENGASFWTLNAYDANYLLSARHVGFYAASAQSKKTGLIDDMMKEIVDENFGAAIPARDWTDYLSVEADKSLAPSTSKAFARRNVLTVLQELAQDSYQRGTYLVFDTQYLDATLLEFRTFAGCLGINRGKTSGSPLVVSEQRSNLVQAVLERDYSDEATIVYAGGQGQEDQRVVVSVEDVVRELETPFSRRELFFNAQQAGTDSAAIEAEARGELQKKRPVIRLSGTIRDTSGMIYGVDYNFGDIVVAEHEGYSMDAHIDAIHVTVGKNGEVIDNKIRGVL